MSTENDPQAVVALQQTQQFISVLEDQMHRAKTETFTATDETGTVTVVVNGDRWLTGLQIEHGLLRLGAETVRERINEALRKAQAAALAAADAEEGQLEDALTAIVGALQQQLGDLRTRV
ncbi:YbaB/EbfC family nucleoid-associated protein [Mycobacterium sp. Aquia_213]|uniref:YbaB/EbfC family nucleoid-associated protein n=1 Tax=Mycobacterium sp. Aquia_213 TaxID=2991728 RepID=UPI00226E1215|nr:YbaB/EbfC family nucleoid-associated protein [Mycobacterium sp. Aquia_213]WAC89316.1 YbaB/EbfC family nucleoid-associated protein [Mycobacterium sp. Aquia_213]